MSPCRNLGAARSRLPLPHYASRPRGPRAQFLGVCPRLSPSRGGEAGAKACHRLDGGHFQQMHPRPSLGKQGVVGSARERSWQVRECHFNQLMDAHRKPAFWTIWLVPTSSSKCPHEKQKRDTDTEEEAPWRGGRSPGVPRVCGRVRQGRVSPQSLRRSVTRDTATSGFASSLGDRGLLFQAPQVCGAVLALQGPLWVLGPWAPAEQLSEGWTVEGTRVPAAPLIPRSTFLGSRVQTELRWTTDHPPGCPDQSLLQGCLPAPGRPLSPRAPDDPCPRWSCCNFQTRAPAGFPELRLGPVNLCDTMASPSAPKPASGKTQTCPRHLVL